MIYQLKQEVKNTRMMSSEMMIMMVASVDVPKRNYDAMACKSDGGRVAACVSSSRRPSSSSVQQEEVPKPKTTCHRRSNQRRVSFIDEVLGHSVVTHTSYRPKTTIEEKPLLYYNSCDYDFFALEAYYEEANALQEEEALLRCRSTVTTKSFGWEDYMSFDSEAETHEDVSQDCNSDLFADDNCSSFLSNSAMRKVKTVRNLHV